MKTTTKLAKAFEIYGPVTLESPILVHAFKRHYESEVVSEYQDAIDKLLNNEAHVEVSFYSEHTHQVQCRWEIYLNNEKVSHFMALVDEDDCNHIKVMEEAIEDEDIDQVKLYMGIMAINYYTAFSVIKDITKALKAK